MRIAGFIQYHSSEIQRDRLSNNDRLMQILGKQRSPVSKP